MNYSVDFTEEGRKYKIIVKGQTINCKVVCCFIWANENKIVKKRYRLEDKDKIIHDNILPSDLI
jgi:hypothetical protein